VAGFFYPANKEELENEISCCFADKKIGPGLDSLPRRAKSSENSSQTNKLVECFVVPHAGYTYSGPVAAHSYAGADDFLLSRCDSFNVIILGPNHSGLGSGVALSPSDQWETPLGQVRVNRAISQEIMGSSAIIDSDALAHQREHSIEVQLPFLQMLARNQHFSFVPICLMLQDLESAQEIAESLFNVIKENKEPFLVLGSSDLTHYEPQRIANSQDQKLLAKIERLDLPSYYATLERNNISACGYGAIAVVMALSKKLGKTGATVLKYATSGDVTGQTDAVVGYSAVRFH
jgi:AmmeMemoRadiSam system protein B